MAEVMVKRHTDAQKFRCMTSMVFHGDRAWERKLAYMQASDLLPAQTESIIGARPVVSDPIERNIEWIFHDKPSHAAGRFNTSLFPAYYTAKEQSTAIAEQKAKAPSSLEELVIFTVVYTGETADIRAAVAAGTFDFSKLDECRSVAARAKQDGLDGVAAPSSRNSGGNCCAILTRTSLRPGKVLEYIEP